MVNEVIAATLLYHPEPTKVSAELATSGLTLPQPAINIFRSTRFTLLLPSQTQLYMWHNCLVTEKSF